LIQSNARGHRGWMPWVVMVVAVVMISRPRTATGQEAGTSDRIIAEALFRSARELMRAGHYAEACRKLEQSQRLARAAGTLLNLAVCHEHEGRLATAWLEYEDSLGLAVRLNRPDREAVIRERMAALEPRIPHVRIVVADDARVEGLAISHDGTEVPEVSWGVRLSLDLGKHTFRATAPGYRPWSTEIAVSEGENVTVVVPRLMRMDSETTAADGRPSSTSAPARVQPPAADRGPTEKTAAGADSAVELRTAAWVGGGLGAAALAAGAWYGVRALQKRSESDRYCFSSGCYVEGVALNQEAHDNAIRSNVLLGAGAVLVGSALVVLTLAPSGQGPPRQEPVVGVLAAPGGGRAVVDVPW